MPATKKRKKAKAPPRAPLRMPEDVKSAIALATGGDYDGAAVRLRDVLEKRPRDAHAHQGMAIVALNLAQNHDGLKLVQSAMTLGLDSAEIHRLRGIALNELGAHAASVEAFERSLAREPDNYHSRCHIAKVLNTLRRYEEALGHAEAALRQRPDDPMPVNELLGAARQLGLWDRAELALKTMMRIAEREVAQGRMSSLTPFAGVVCGVPAELHNRIARSWARFQGTSTKSQPRPPVRPKDVLHVAYLSPDLNVHPVGMLLEPVFRWHDRERVTVSALSLKNAYDRITERIEASADHFVAAHRMDDNELEAWIRENEVDVLVDCAGYTLQNRNAVLVREPAPIRVHYLGYPGTLGTRLVDYHLTVEARDPVDTEAYDEALVFLPGSFVAPDSLPRPEVLPTRLSHGLPADRRLFGFLGVHYRIEPRVWAAWMEILRAAPEVDLVLMDGPARPRLETRAREAGFADRLHFLPHALLSKTWSQVMLDLYLDTFVVTAGTGGIITVYSGVPLLTVKGPKPESRTGAAVVSALGRPDMAVDDEAAYVARAIELGRDGASLRALRRDFEARRATAPLFDAPRFARDLEDAYRQMWDRAVEGRPFESFRVRPSE